LLLPLLLGTLLVVSIQSWLRALSFGRFSGSFFAFFPLFFNGLYTGPLSSGNYEWGHLWFLAYLFVFSALALPLFLSIRQKGEGSRILSVARRFAAMPLILLTDLFVSSRTIFSSSIARSHNRASFGLSFFSEKPAQNPTGQCSHDAILNIRWSIIP
jgi:hypothetical protein